MEPKGSSGDAVELLGRIPLFGLGQDGIRDLSTALPLASQAATSLEMTVGWGCRERTQLVRVQAKSRNPHFAGSSK
jgi:hypothetical protein